MSSNDNHPRMPDENALELGIMDHENEGKAESLVTNAQKVAADGEKHINSAHNSSDANLQNPVDSVAENDVPVEERENLEDRDTGKGSHGGSHTNASNDGRDDRTGFQDQKSNDADFWPKLQESLATVANIDTVLSFDLLSKANLVYLQKELLILDAEHTQSEMNEAWSKRVEQTLRNYATAIRDYEYIAGLKDANIEKSYKRVFWKWGVEGCPSGVFVDNKVLPQGTAPTDSLRKWLRIYLPSGLTWTEGEQWRRYNEYHSSSRPTPDITSPFVDKSARFIVALTGGLSLVVPMIIMSIHQNPNKSLIVTSVSVVLFSAAVSLLFSASNAETLGITAAYAAVLVVFVGTSSQ